MIYSRFSGDSQLARPVLAGCLHLRINQDFAEFVDRNRGGLYLVQCASQPRGRHADCVSLLPERK
jgi:hypothetical protein